MAKAKYQAPKPRTKTEQLKEKAQKAKSFLYKSPTGQKVLGYRKKFAEGSSIETYNAQVQRKYHGGSVKRKQSGGVAKTPILAQTAQKKTT